MHRGKNGRTSDPYNVFLILSSALFERRMGNSLLKLISSHLSERSKGTTWLRSVVSGLLKTAVQLTNSV